MLVHVHAACLHGTTTIQIINFIPIQPATLQLQLRPNSNYKHHARLTFQHTTSRNKSAIQPQLAATSQQASNTQLPATSEQHSTTTCRNKSATIQHNVPQQISNIQPQLAATSQQHSTTHPAAANQQHTTCCCK